MYTVKKKNLPISFETMIKGLYKYSSQSKFCLNLFWLYYSIHRLFLPVEKVFNRSYKYELDCIEAVRREKIKAKSLHDQTVFEQDFQELENLHKQMQKTSLVVDACEIEPPFWWRDFSQSEKTDNEISLKLEDETKLGETTYQKSYAHWQEPPNLTGYVQDDPCKRKREMRL